MARKCILGVHILPDHLPPVQRVPHFDFMIRQYVINILLEMEKQASCAPPGMFTSSPVFYQASKEFTQLIRTIGMKDLLVGRNIGNTLGKYCQNEVEDD